MHKRKPASWRPQIVVLILFVAFIFVKLTDPVDVDQAIDNVSRHFVGRVLSWYYNYLVLRDSPPPLTVVGLFEDSFKDQISAQPPTPEQFATIINRLVEFGASEIVLDMAMRMGDGAMPADDPLVQALDAAYVKKVPVILPFRSNDAIECLDRSVEIRRGSVQCAAAARGAVEFVADDATAYYPLFIVQTGNDDAPVPSLAWISYLKLLDLSATPAKTFGFRHPMDDDLFVVWRQAEAVGDYTFCSFAVRQLLADPVIGESHCLAQAKGKDNEATGSISIQSLVKDKIVLIGQAGRDNKDLISTPFGILQPGIMLHATVLDNLLMFGGRYPVNRDDLFCKAGWFELRLSQFYMLLCCLFPLAIKSAGLIIKKSRSGRRLGLWLGHNAVILGFLLSLSVIPLLPVGLSTLNALVVFTSVYVILSVATVVDRIIEMEMERRNG